MPDDRYGCPRWFFRKEDVHALMQDPQYCKRHARYRQSCTPDAAAAREAKRLAVTEEELIACWKATIYGRLPHGMCRYVGDPRDREVPLLHKDPADSPSYWRTLEDWKWEMGP